MSMDRETEERVILIQLRQDFIAGKLPIPPSFGTPYDFRIEDISDLGRNFVFFEDPKEAEESLNHAIEGVDSFGAFLGGLKFLSSFYDPRPEIDIQFPKDEKELDGPKLDSFSEDNRVIVKALKGIFKRLKVKATACFDFGNISFEDKVFIVRETKLRRNYGVELVESDDKTEEYVINIQRCPIVFNCGAPELDIYAGLAYDVFLNQVEPFTSHRILKDELNPNSFAEKGDWLFHAIQTQRRYEEELVANALIKAWLTEKWPQKIDFSFFNFREFPDRHNSDSLRQVLEKGPERVAAFYCCDNWDLEKFLKGDF